MPNLKGIRVNVLGLASKPETDDTRESPPLKIINLLVENRALVTGYDLIAQSQVKQLLNKKNWSLSSELDASIKEAEAIILATSWQELEAPSNLL